jgi:hypothetical protein
MFEPMDRKEVERYILRVAEWVQRFHKGQETLVERAYQIQMQSITDKTAPIERLGHELDVAVLDFDNAQVEKLDHNDPAALTYLFKTAQCVQLTVDRARAHKVLEVNDTEERISDCTQENIELHKQLREARRRISDLESLVRLHGGDPDRELNTFTDDLGRGDDRHE